MRVNDRFDSFDRSCELHESRRELQKQAIFKSLPIRRRRKKENITSYHRQVRSNDSVCQQFDKRQKTKKKEAGKQRAKTEKLKRKTLVNSHATLPARLTEQ